MAKSPTFDEKLAELQIGDRPVFRRGRPSTSAADDARRGLEQMRERHAAVLRRLQEQAQDNPGEDDVEMRKKMELEMESLRQKLVVKQQSEQALGDLQNQHTQRMADMRHDVTRSLTEELAKVREATSGDVKSIKETFERRIQEFEAAQQQRRRETSEQQEAQIKRMQAEIQEVHKARRRAEEESASLRVAVASAEERVSATRTMQEDLCRDRDQIEASVTALQGQRDERQERLRTTELDLHRCRTEIEMQKSELSRVAVMRAAEDEALGREREAWRQREGQIQEQLQWLRSQLAEVKSGAERRALVASAEQQDAEAEARRRLAKATEAAAAADRRLTEAQGAQAKLQAQIEDSQRRSQGLYENTTMAVEVLEDDLDQARQREAELMTMMSDFQHVISQSPALARPRVGLAVANEYRR